MVRLVRVAATQMAISRDVAANLVRVTGCVCIVVIDRSGSEERERQRVE